MKKFFTVFFFIVISLPVLSQVPNSSFENWTLGDPDGWATSNVQGIVFPVNQSSDAHSGSSAVRGEVLTFFTTNLAPILQTGPDATGFPITVKYNTLKGFFKFAPLGGDRLSFTVGMYVGSPDSAIGVGAVVNSNTINSYTEISVPITYFNPGNPDICIINITVIGPVTGPDYHAGTVLFADDISLSVEATSINEHPEMPYTFKVEQNFPNPFNPSTKIKYSIPEPARVEFSVYNLIGKEVFNEEYLKTAGEQEITFNSGNLPSGVYFYTIKAGNNSATRKFIIMR